jgi:hypothetical protein
VSLSYPYGEVFNMGIEFFNEEPSIESSALIQNLF